MGKTKCVPLVARVLLAALFIFSGFGKLMGLAGTGAALASVGIPGGVALAAIVAIIELAGGLMILLGWQARLGAWALIVFTVLATAFFHNNLADQMQLIMALKNASIVGGLLLLATYGSGPMSLGCRCGKSWCMDCKAKQCEGGSCDHE